MSTTTPLTEVCNFARSSIRWCIDTTKGPPMTVTRPPPTTLNDVRMPLDCVVTVTRAGRRDEFGLGTSCKTEQVFVERDVWHQPNGDMLAISSADEFLIVTRYDKADKGIMRSPPNTGSQPERLCVDPAVAFDTHSLSLRRRTARRLESIEEIIGIFRSDREVVSRTTYAIESGEMTVEYPVKTVNYSDRHRYFQVDTGPVLFFGEPTGPKTIEHLHLAYVAHLGGDWAEFIVSRPTPLEGHGVSVHHYSEVRRVTAQNSLWVIDEA